MFASGRKHWELRSCGRQFAPEHLIPGRRVELRKGYCDKTAALWGTLAEFCEARSVASFFEMVPFREVIPAASNRKDAVQTAIRILGDAKAPVIGFRIAVDPAVEIPVHLDCLLLVQRGRKQSTICKGVRKLESNLAALVSGPERSLVLVTDVKAKPVHALSEMDAQRDGFETLAELKSALCCLYTHISPADIITIIGFKPLLEER